MRITSLSSRRKAVATLSLAAVAAVATGVVAAPTASAAAIAMTLSASSGPSAGGNSLTATTATAAFYSGATLEFVYKTTSSTTCPTTYTTPTSTIVATVALPKVLSTKKIAFTVPAGVTITPASPATSASWLTCTYSGGTNGSSPVTGTAAYTVATAPTVTSFTPVTGPALGGGTITITGTGFTGTTSASTTTAKIGSVALTGVAWVNSTTLTGVVPPQAAATGLSVSVTNTGGTALDGVHTYDYTNGIVASPSTTPSNTAVTDVDIQGVGFSSLAFSATTGSAIDAATSHVYLVDGEYDPTDPATTAKALGELGECINVLVISDNELICTVNTADSDGAGSAGAVIVDGTYTLTVVSNGAIDVQPGGTVADADYAQSIVSSGSTFTVAAY